MQHDGKTKPLPKILDFCCSIVLKYLVLLIWLIWDPVKLKKKKKKCNDLVLAYVLAKLDYISYIDLNLWIYDPYKVMKCSNWALPLLAPVFGLQSYGSMCSFWLGVSSFNVKLDLAWSQTKKKKIRHVVWALMAYVSSIANVFLSLRRDLWRPMNGFRSHSLFLSFSVALLLTIHSLLLNKI